MRLTLLATAPKGTLLKKGVKEGEQVKKETSELLPEKRQRRASFSSGLRLVCGDQHLCSKVNGLDKRCLRINRCKDHGFLPGQGCCCSVAKSCLTLCKVKE